MRVGHTLPDEIPVVADDQIGKTTRAFAQQVVAEYRDNAKLGRSTVLLCGEEHCTMQHFLFKMLLLDGLLKSLCASRIRVGFEIPAKNEEVELRPFQAIVRDGHGKSIGELATLYPGKTNYLDRTSIAVMVTQSLASNVRVSFTDMNRHENIYFKEQLCEEAVLRLKDSPSYSRTALEIPLTCTHECDTKNGMTLRDIHMTDRIDDIIQQEESPVLMLQHTGLAHIVSHDEYRRPTLASILNGNKHDVLALLFTDHRYTRRDSQRDLDCSINMPEKIFVFDMKLDNCDWNALCLQNAAPHLQML